MVYLRRWPEPASAIGLNFAAFAAVRSPFSGMNWRRSRTEGGREKVGQSICGDGVVGEWPEGVVLVGLGRPGYRVCGEDFQKFPENSGIMK